MPRTIDATLTAALAAGTGIPYMQAYIGYTNGTVKHSGPAIAYKLTGDTLEFETAYQADLGGDQDCIWLERGLTIAGTNYTETTGRFRIHSQTYMPNGHQVARGRLFPKKLYTAEGYHSYQDVITAFCAAYGKTAVFRDPAAAWLAYAFYPNYQNITINDANYMGPLLMQKYLIFFCDNGNEEVLFYSCDGSLNVAADLTIAPTNDFTKQTSTLLRRQFIWRDENGAIHTAGTATDPIHNLGFLQTTASAPLRRTSAGAMEAHTRPDLRALDGDIVDVQVIGASNKLFALVTEQYTPPTRGHPQPRWETIITANEVFGNTAGGALPSTIERVSNYTPLNTSAFDGILSADDNNLQAAMDRIDKLPLMLGTHGMGGTIPAGTTYYAVPFGSGLLTAVAEAIVSKGGTIKDLYIRTGAQPASGTLVITLVVDDLDTALTVTVPAGAAPATRSDTSHTALLSAGSSLHFKLVNNATSPSAAVTGLVFDLTP